MELHLWLKHGVGYKEEMKRGKKGCFVYFINEKTREFMKTFVSIFCRCV